MENKYSSFFTSFIFNCSWLISLPEISKWNLCNKILGEFIIYNPKKFFHPQKCDYDYSFLIKNFSIIYILMNILLKKVKTLIFVTLFII